MPDEPKPEPQDSVEPAAEATPAAPEKQEDDVSEFITRNVLEKGTVFFEG